MTTTCPACAGTGDCQACIDADSYACSECSCTGECPKCDGPALPPWEAVYDSATFTPRLLAYCNDEVAARGAAEAWLRAHCEDAAGLEWTPDPQMAVREWDRWLSLSRTHEDGTPLETEIVVRRRATTTAQES